MISSHDTFGVVVTNPKGKTWIEAPHTERDAWELAILLRAFGCVAEVVPMNYTEIPIGDN